MLRKGGGNWVQGDRFYNRAIELEALEERIRDGNHTLLTAQRRMGKTSLVRELFRRLEKTDEYATVFVDLEAATDPSDAIAEIAFQARPLQGAWKSMRRSFANTLQAIGKIEEVSVADLKVKLRASVNAGNWQQKGEEVYAALAKNELPVVLAIDELPILINRLLKGDGKHITQEGKEIADVFLSWLRKCGQSHRNQVTMILSGSIGLEPILRQANLSAHANIFSSYDLKPWSEETAASCLKKLGRTYEIELSCEVCQDMCSRLRCCIPHHVQMFFDRVHEHLRRNGRHVASLDDVKDVYKYEMLSVRGQIDLQHYQSRLEMMLDKTSYRIALDILTETAVTKRFDENNITQYHTYFVQNSNEEVNTISIGEVLHVLQHDGYLEKESRSYRFVSGLLEDWWQSRYEQNFVPVHKRLQ